MLTFKQWEPKAVKRALNGYRTQHGNVTLRHFLTHGHAPASLATMAEIYAKDAGCTMDTGIQQIVEAINLKHRAKEYREAIL